MTTTIFRYQNHIKVKSGHIEFDKPFIHINGKYYEFNGSEEGLRELGPLGIKLLWEGVENSNA